jgi:hypothetical protein
VTGPGSTAPSYRALFEVPTLGRVILSMQLARVAQSMVSVAIVLFALAEYRSAAVAGIVTFASLFPGIVLSPVAGALLLFAAGTTEAAVGYLALGGCLVILGLLNGPMDIGLFTMRQRRTDPALLGRAFAVSMAFNFLGYPVGAAIAGSLATASIEAAIWLGVGASALAVVFAACMVPRQDPADASAARGDPGQAAGEMAGAGVGTGSGST